MKPEQIEEILKNEPDKIHSYLNLLMEKCKEIDRQSNFISILMLILFSINYLSKNAIAESLQIGPLSIKDIQSINIFIPLVFSFLIFRYTIIHNHRAEVQDILSSLSKEYFKIGSSNVDDFIRTIVPVSNSSELAKYDTKGVLGCLGVLLIIPIAFIPLISLVIEYYWIKEYVLIFSKLNFIHKTSIVCSIWISVVALYHILHTIYISFKKIS